jgi:hypothetical protein
MNGIGVTMIARNVLGSNQQCLLIATSEHAYASSVIRYLDRL